MDPGDRREQHAEQRGDRDALHLPALPGQPPGHREASHRDQHGHRGPQRAGGLSGQELPEQDAAQRLVGGARVGPEPPGLEDRARPVGDRITRQQQPGAERPGQRRGRRRHRGPPPAGQPQVHDENPGHQLDRGGQPHQRAARPARRPGRAVRHGHRQQHRVHLAEPHFIAHREQVGAGREDDREHRRAQRPGGCPPQQRREREPDDHRERDVDEGHPGQLGGRPGQQRQRHREERGGRRVGEREQLRRRGQHGVERLALQHAQAAGAVDVEVHHPLVGHAGQVPADQRLDGGQRRDPGQHRERDDRPRRPAAQPPGQAAGPACRSPAARLGRGRDPGGGAQLTAPLAGASLASGAASRTGPAGAGAPRAQHQEHQPHGGRGEHRGRHPVPDHRLQPAEPGRQRHVGLAGRQVAEPERRRPGQQQPAEGLDGTA